MKSIRIDKDKSNPSVINFSRIWNVLSYCESENKPWFYSSSYLALKRKLDSSILVSKNKFKNLRLARGFDVNINIVNENVQ